MIPRLASILLVLLVLGNPLPARGQNTAFVMDSDPGDYNGDGQNYYFTPPSGNFTATKNFDNGVRISVSSGNHYWDLDFAGPNKAPLTVQRYENATRFPFQADGFPGFAVAGDGRDCGGEEGSFDVKEIVYGSGNTIVRFHATFVQHCSGSGPGLTGEILYFSNDPLPPVNHLTSNLTVFGTRNQPFRYRIKASNQPTSFTASNLPAGLSVDSGTGIISGTPTVEGHFPVSSTATGANGTASGTLDLTIDPPGRSTGAYTALSLRSESGEPLGQGGTFYYNPFDGYFASSSVAQISFATPVVNSQFEDWYLTFDSPSGSRIDVGTYFNTTEFPSPSNPGLSVSGQGLGCNTATGDFEIKEISVINGRLVTFHATFVQHCDGDPPALRGEIWFNATRAITSNPAPTATRGSPFSYQIVGNNTPTSFGASALPPGLSIDTASGIISGTPSIGGTYSIPVSAIGPSDTITERIALVIGLPFEVIPAPVITSRPTAGGTVNQAFSYQATASNNPMEFAASGLPAGVSINPTTGLISGIPTVTGTFDVLLSASNVLGAAGGSSLTLTIYPPLPVITTSNSASGIRGQPFSFQVAASNQPTGFSIDGQPSGVTIDATNGLLSGTPNQSGTFQMTIRATNGTGTTSQGFTLTVVTPTPTPTPSPTPFATITPIPTPTAIPTGTPATPTPTATATATASPGSVGNISTRLPVGAGDNALIEGFIVQGNQGSTKQILVRAIGPSLKGFGITDALANPVLEIHDASSATVATNNDWRSTQIGGLITSDQAEEINNSGLAPGDDLESAIIASLTPGAYTAVVRGLGGNVGTGVVDAYDLSSSSPARLANIATRGLVQAGDRLMVAGFIVQGAPVKAVIRAIGPSLQGSGITNALPDTTLQLRDQNGAVVLENDNWQTDQKQELENTGLQPSHDLEAALVADIQPGLYTAQVRGKNDTTGIGVVQVYFLQ